MISEISEIIYREIVPLIFYICIHNLCDIILFSVSGKPERLLWQRMWIQLNHCMRSHLPNQSLHTVSNTQYSIYFLETLENIYFINIRVMCSRNYGGFMVYALQPYLVGKILILSCLKKTIKIGITWNENSLIAWTIKGNVKRSINQLS